MPFELEQMTKCRLAEVVVLSQKNRQPDENPGAKLSFEASLGNDVLAYFDGHLKSFLFTKKAGAGLSDQAVLDGVPVVSDMPNLTLIGARVGSLHWEDELTGYELVIDHGMGGKSNLEVGDCIVGNFRMKPKNGGTVEVKFDVESADVSEAAFGKLAKMKSREIDVTLMPSESMQRELEPQQAKPKRSKVIDGTKGHPALAGKAAGPEDSDSEGGERDASSEQPTDPQRGEGWPFPKDEFKSAETAPQSVTTEVVPNRRTKRGRDATAAFLAGQGVGE